LVKPRRKDSRYKAQGTGKAQGARYKAQERQKAQERPRILSDNEGIKD